MTLTKLVDSVKLILEKDEKARDNDLRLECLIYMKYFDLEKTSVLEFYNKLNESNIPSSSSIRRARRKCQELYLDTRGKKYSERQDRQKQVKDDLQDAKLNSSNPSWY